MITTIDEFIQTFPNFAQKETNNLSFAGNIKTKNGVLRVDFYLPNFPSIDDMKIKIFRGFEECYIDSSKLDLKCNIREFLDKLPFIVKFKSKFTDGLADNCDFGMKMTQVCELKSNNYKVYVKKSYKHFRITDFLNYERHYLEMRINDELAIEVIDHSLPIQLTNEHLFKSSDSIACYIRQFHKCLDQLDDFYENINSIDELCYVVEPINTTTKDNWRTFKLNEKVYIKVTIDPFSPSSVAVNLMGPTYQVEKYRALYNERASSWDIETDVHKNLLRIFELFYFPMRPENHQTSNEEEKYCNICYTYNLENRIPIVSCDNPKCDLIFHAVCLKEWFSTLMDGKTFLTVTLGFCPYCKEKLSASFAHLLEF